MITTRTEYDDSQLRQWQVEAVDKWLDDFLPYGKSANKTYVVEACPGAGKTRFGVALICETKKYFRRLGYNDPYFIVLTPSLAINNGWVNAIESTLLDGKPITCSAQKNYHPDVCVRVQTYQNDVNEALIDLDSKKIDLFIICDEHHHCEETRDYGLNVIDSAEELSDYPVIMLSGTPWRSTGKIALLKNKCNEDESLVNPDFRYSYYDDLTAAKNRGTLACSFELVTSTAKSDKESYYTVFTPEQEAQYRQDNAKPPEHDGKMSHHVHYDPAHEGTTAKSILGRVKDELNNARKRYKWNGIMSLVIAKNISQAYEIDKYLVQVLGLRSEVIVSKTKEDSRQLQKASARISEINRELQNERPNVPDVIVSVGIFTEGVDVPAIKVIGYLSPKTTLLCLTQTAFRALRRVRIPESMKAVYNGMRFFDPDETGNEHKWGGVFIAPAHPWVNYFALRMEMDIKKAQYKKQPPLPEKPLIPPPPPPPVIYPATIAGDSTTFYLSDLTDVVNKAQELWEYEDIQDMFGTFERFDERWKSFLAPHNDRINPILECCRWLEKKKQQCTGKPKTAPTMSTEPANVTQQTFMTTDQQFNEARSLIQKYVSMIRYSNIVFNGQRFCDIENGGTQQDSDAYKNIRFQINTIFGKKTIKDYSLDELNECIKLLQYMLLKQTLDVSRADLHNYLNNKEL